jgi:hypothetical protein
MPLSWELKAKVRLAKAVMRTCHTAQKADVTREVHVQISAGVRLGGRHVSVTMAAGSSIHIYANPEHPLLLFQTIPQLHLTSSGWVVLNWGRNSAGADLSPLTNKPLAKPPLRLPSTMHMVPDTLSSAPGHTRVLRRAVDAATFTSGGCVPCCGVQEQPRSFRPAASAKLSTSASGRLTEILANSVSSSSVRRLLRGRDAEGVVSCSKHSVLREGGGIRQGSAPWGDTSSNWGGASNCIAGRSASQKWDELRLLRSAFDCWRASCVHEGVLASL